MGFVGEHAQTRVERKKLAAADFSSGVARYRLNKLKSTDVDYIQYATASTDDVYGRTEDVRTATQISTDGLDDIDVSIPVIGDKVTLVASAAISALAYVQPTTAGKVVAASTNATPIATIVYARALEAATADGDEILCQIIRGTVTI